MLILEEDDWIDEEIELLRKQKEAATKPFDFRIESLTKLKAMRRSLINQMETKPRECLLKKAEAYFNQEEMAIVREHFGMAALRYVGNDDL